VSDETGHGVKKEIPENIFTSHPQPIDLTIDDSPSPASSPELTPPPPAQPTRAIVPSFTNRPLTPLLLTQPLQQQSQNDESDFDMYSSDKDNDRNMDVDRDRKLKEIADEEDQKEARLQKKGGVGQEVERDDRMDDDETQSEVEVDADQEVRKRGGAGMRRSKRSNLRKKQVGVFLKKVRKEKKGKKTEDLDEESNENQSPPTEAAFLNKDSNAVVTPSNPTASKRLFPKPSIPVPTTSHLSLDPPLAEAATVILPDFETESGVTSDQLIEHVAALFSVTSEVRLGIMGTPREELMKLYTDFINSKKRKEVHQGLSPVHKRMRSSTYGGGKEPKTTDSESGDNGGESE
jgi:hypothetical protein